LTLLGRVDLWVTANVRVLRHAKLQDRFFKRPFPSPWRPEHGTRRPSTRVNRSLKVAENC
jgi:hypothetical protein